MNDERPPSGGLHLPLASFEQVHTRDVDQAREAVADAFCPHVLKPLDRARRFDTRFHSFSTDNVGVSYLDYGGSVHIKPFAQETFYLVLIPLAGKARISYGRPEWFEYDSTSASVPPVDRNYSLHVDEGSPHLAVWIARAPLEEHLRRLVYRSVPEPIRFDVGMDFRLRAAQSWLNVVKLLIHEVDTGGLILTQRLAMQHVEQLLMTNLLLAQTNNYSSLLHIDHVPAVAPRAIKRALEMIAARAAEPFAVAKIAEEAGLSVRALQEGFRRFYKTTPTHYLRDVRLSRVRQELIAADHTGATVTGIAARWGFVHGGRFSRLYREQFGELPSATLRR